MQCVYDVPSRFRNKNIYTNVGIEVMLPQGQLPSLVGLGCDVSGPKRSIREDEHEHGSGPECVLCSNVLDESTLTLPCGHNLHLGCHNLLVQMDNLKCPACMAPFTAMSKCDYCDRIRPCTDCGMCGGSFCDACKPSDATGHSCVQIIKRGHYERGPGRERRPPLPPPRPPGHGLSVNPPSG